MFGIGFDEFLLIIIIAILFLGPDKLPEAMVKVGRFIKSVKKVMNDAKYSIESEIKIADLKEETLKYKKQLDDTVNDLNGFKNVGINPKKEIDDAIGAAKDTFNGDTA
ncbi:MAG: Sec-independent protein translocase subunit TatB, partial [Epsilonproteobacteria bacterium]|nr:Sec-independent protein translocase subunit TatB [Campylobacterota bacterium]